MKNEELKMKNFGEAPLPNILKLLVARCQSFAIKLQMASFGATPLL
jgi:hypothetical protein